jgi:hypothetical protein
VPVVVLVAGVAFVAIRALLRRRRGEIVDAAEVGALGWVAGANWGVVRALARADARRLLRHPAFLAALALTPLMLEAAMEGDPRWLHRSTSMALAMVPLGWLTIVATNLMALRPRRAGVDELFSAAPSPQPVRTTGLLVSGWVAVAAAVLLAAGWLAISAATVDDAVGSPRLAEIAAGFLIVAGAVVVGVAVARWLPHLGFGVLAAFTVTFLQARFMDPSTWPWNTAESHPGRFLGFLAEPTSTGVPQLEVRPAGWHLVYLAGLVLLMAVVALARDGFPRRLRAAMAAVVVVVAGAGWMQTRPLSEARVAAMAGYLTDPIAHQTCSVAGPTTFCAYDEQLHRVDAWSARDRAVRALLPAAVAGRELAVTDRAPTVVGNSSCGPQSFLEGLPTAVTSAVSPGDIWPDDGAVHPGTNRFPCGGREVDELFTALQIGSWAVGLPPSPHGLDVRCDAGGQARAVAALWLAGAATPGGARTLHEMAVEHGRGPVTFATWTDPPMLGAVFASADVQLAIALLGLPAERVSAALAERWSLVTDPATPSAALAGAFGLASTGAPAGGAGTCR